MKAINYFGFNNGATMFNGLYAGWNSLTQDFGMNLYRIQARLLLHPDHFSCTAKPLILKAAIDFV